jgi:uroporphyrinogen-III synthase
LTPSPRKPRVLITRTRHQASELASALERLGAETILVPTIEVAPPASFSSLDAAIATLSQPENSIDWVIFTSGNAVHPLAARAREQGITLHLNRIAAIGPATAKAVQEMGLKPLLAPVLVAHEFIGEALAEDLLAQAEPSAQHFLLVRAEEAREIIPGILQAAGHAVTVAAAYRNIVPADAIPALRRIFNSTESSPDAITFTSSSTARNLIALLESAGHRIPPSVVIASIGPITSGTLRSLGYEPTLEAPQPTIASLAAAIAAHLGLSAQTTSTDPQTP